MEYNASQCSGMSLQGISTIYIFSVKNILEKTAQRQKTMLKQKMNKKRRNRTKQNNG